MLYETFDLKQSFLCLPIESSFPKRSVKNVKETKVATIGYYRLNFFRNEYTVCQNYSPYTLRMPILRMFTSITS